MANLDAALKAIRWWHASLVEPATEVYIKDIVSMALQAYHGPVDMPLELTRDAVLELLAQNNLHCLEKSFCRDWLAMYGALHGAAGAGARDEARSGAGGLP